MNKKLGWMRRFGALILFVILLSAKNLPVSAQGGFSVVLYAPEIDDFPNVILYVDAYDAQGKFIPGLDLDSFAVFEDGFETPVNETKLLEPGLHTIIAVNLGATLSNRANASLPTRYETAIFDIASWLNNLDSAGTNQYSLTSNEGILVEKLQEKDAFTFQIQNYKPNLFNFAPNLTSLNAALAIAEKPNLIPQSKQSILYITPLPLDSDLPAINSLYARAVAARVPINVWLMGPDTAANSPAAVSLNQLAVSTGGKFLLYTEESPQPDAEEYAGLMRSVYRLSYTSTVNQSGAHTVRVEARYGDQEAASSEIPYSIDLNLPSTALIDLPGVIDRRYEETGSERELQPTFVTLQAEFLFPDGYNRQLKTTRLYIDGEIITENTREPFNFFAWPLDDYTFSGEHLVSVEVEDILGFRSISPPRPVMITVESLYPVWLAAFLQFFNRGGWILFAVLGLGITIFTGMRIRRRMQMRTTPSHGSGEEPAIDPLIQTIPGLSNDAADQTLEAKHAPLYSTGQERIPAPQLKSVAGSPNSTPEKIEISREELIIGSDAEEAEIILAHPSVSPRHTRILLNPSGNVTIADLGSKTGTWVNYTPISSAGTVLKNGDLVKIGDFSFRYDLGLESSGK